MVSYVYEFSGARERLVGRVEFRTGVLYAGDVEFTYHPSWIESGYALGPGMPLAQGMQIFRSVPGPLSDAGPDAWGKGILRDAADRAQLRLVHDGDFITHAPDETRQGALRFSPREEGGGWTGEFGRTPGLHDLTSVLEAAERYQEAEETDEDLRILLAAGSSPGGARPKAVLRDDDGSLWLAKFRAGGDRHDVPAWEAVMLDLARRAGVTVPEFRVHRAGESRSILVMRRFDRRGALRRGYISARSMLGASEADINVRASYVRIAQAQRYATSDPDASALQLLRRAALNILVNNIDDHLRNHGYLREVAGWTLSPAFDITPWPWGEAAMPVTVQSSSVARSVADLVRHAGAFGLRESAAREAVREVVRAVESWRDVAACWIVDDDEIDYMASAFLRDHTEATDM